MQQPVSIRDLWDGQVDRAVQEKHALYRGALVEQAAVEHSEKPSDNHSALTESTADG